MFLWNMYCKHKEVINYLIFGFLTTLLTLITYYLLTLTILDVQVPLELQLANIISWTIGFLFAYITNRKYVFQSKNDRVTGEFLKFLGSRLFTLILDMAIMYVFVTILKYDNRIIKLISQVIIIVSNYLLSKLIVFGKKK